MHYGPEHSHGTQPDRAWYMYVRNQSMVLGYIRLVTRAIDSHDFLGLSVREVCPSPSKNDYFVRARRV